MPHNYEKTSRYWNDIYEEMALYDPKTVLGMSKLETSLDWLTESGNTVLDFGCGTGHMLLRCLEKGALKTIGVDVSYHAISLSRRTAVEHYTALRTKWIWGDVKSLMQLPDACVSGVILSSVLDNLLPEDGQTLLSSVARLLDNHGRVLLIINTYLPEDSIVAEGLIQLADEEGAPIPNSYSYSNGIYLWNLSDGDLAGLIEDEFKIVESSILNVSEGLIRRIYQLELK